jgi:hypothetical protein
MRSLFLKTILIAGAALAVSACNRGGPTANKVTANEVDANMMLSAPGNDQSAMESVTNVAEPMPAPATNSSSNAATGQTSGGDTGGNNVEANTVGM